MLEIRVFWDVMCYQVNSSRFFKESLCLLGLVDPESEGRRLCFHEMSVNIYPVTQNNIS
jgi:hypothetical protein